MSEQQDGALHPTYRWHTFDRRISWRKLKLYYAETRNQVAMLWFGVGVVVLPVAYGYFLTTARSLFGFAVVTVLVLITVHGLRAGVENVWRFWRTTEMNNHPPPTRVENINRMNNVRYRRDPATVVDSQVALNARVMLYDHVTTPEQVYACIGFGSEAGQFFHLDSPGHDVSILYLDVILARARATGKGAVRSLVVTDIHELTHWALSVEENAQVPTEHSQQWNEVIGREMDYVMGSERDMLKPEEINQ